MDDLVKRLTKELGVTKKQGCGPASRTWLGATTSSS